MATLATETWTGTTGAAWPAQWTTTGTVDIQSNQGRMLTPATAYGTGVTASLGTMAAVADAEVSFTWTSPPAIAGETMYFAAALRAGSTFVGYAPATGYWLEFCPSTGALGVISLVRGNGTANGTILKSTGFTWAASTAYRARFRVVGSFLMAKVWPSASAEPATWTITAVDTAVTAAGRLAFSAASGSAATARDVRLDDLSITDITTYPPGTPMQHWRTALAANNATALLIGDSLTEGQGASTKANRWLDLIQGPVRTNAGIPAGGVGYLPALYATYSPDSPWKPYSSQTGTHAIDTGSYSPGRRADNMTAAATTTFTVTGTSADLWWISGYGSFTYKIDAAAAVTVNTAGPVGVPNRTTVSLGAAGSHTVLITATTAVRFAGLMVYNGDTTTGLRVVDAAKTGANSADFTDLAQVWALVAPDLAVIELGVNDYLHIPASSAQVKANIKAIIANVRAAVGKSLSIAVVLPAAVTAAPDAGQTEAWSAYRSAIMAVATEDTSVQLISWESAGSAPSASYRSDNLHYSDTGQQVVADLMVAALALRLDKLRLGAGTVGLRLGANPVDKVYIGATQVWP